MKLSWLHERFARSADSLAFIQPERGTSYAELTALVAAWQQRFASAGVRGGAVVALEADHSPEAAAALLALAERDAVVVPIAPGAHANRARLHEIAEVEWILSQPGWRIEATGRHAAHPLIERLRSNRHPGLVLFSSGSTGEPKAVLHDLARLLGRYESVPAARRTLVFLLFDHIGGFNTLCHTLAGAGTLVLTNERSPDAVAALIARHRVELLPTTPTFLNLLLLSEAHRRHDLTSLQLITYGTEPMPEITLRRLHEALPRVQLKQTYGLSELGILPTRSAAVDSLWMQVGGRGCETKIVDGVLWIRAETAMLGYLNAPSPFDAEGWFNTGDAVREEGGALRVIGRQSQTINVGGLKVHPAEIEDVLLALPGVADVTVRGEANPLTGQIVVAEFVLEKDEPAAALRQRVRAYCRDRLAPYKIPTRVGVKPATDPTARFKKQRPPASTTS